MGSAMTARGTGVEADRSARRTKRVSRTPVGGARSTSRRRWPLVLLGFVVALLIFGGFQQAALGDFRQLERDYIASRQVTACANQALIPLAFGDMDDLDTVLETIVTGSAVEIALVSERFADHGRPSPFPRLGRAHRAVGRAIDEQVELYRAMVDDPENSADELDRFTERYQQAERAIAGARSVLFVGQGEGWARRGVCRAPPPDTTER